MKVRFSLLRLLLLVVALILPLAVSSCDGGRSGYPDGTIIPQGVITVDDGIPIFLRKGSAF